MCSGRWLGLLGEWMPDAPAAVMGVAAEVALNECSAAELAAERVSAVALGMIDTDMRSGLRRCVWLGNQNSIDLGHSAKCGASWGG